MGICPGYTTAGQTIVERALSQWNVRACALLRLCARELAILKLRRDRVQFAIIRYTIAVRDLLRTLQSLYVRCLKLGCNRVELTIYCGHFCAFLSRRHRDVYDVDARRLTRQRKHLVNSNTGSDDGVTHRSFA